MKRRLVVLGVAVLALVWPLPPAEARTNTVPSTRLTKFTKARTVNELAPNECAGINLVNLVMVSGTGGTATGTASNDLILGGPNADSLNGGGGDDCLVGGGGIDTLTGGSGSGDVCLGGAGLDLFFTCETQVQ